MKACELEGVCGEQNESGTAVLETVCRKFTSACRKKLQLFMGSVAEGARSRRVCDVKIRQLRRGGRCDVIENHMQWLWWL